MGGQRPEQVRPQHRRDHGAETTRRLAGDAAQLPVGNCAVMLVHPRHHLLAQVRVVLASPRRVDELRTAVACPRVDVNHHAPGCAALGEHGVGRFQKSLLERRVVGPHGHVARIALEHVNGGVPDIWGGVVARRHVHPNGPYMWVRQRVVNQQLGGDGAPVKTAGKFSVPWQHRPIQARESWERPRPKLSERAQGLGTNRAAEGRTCSVRQGRPQSCGAGPRRPVSPAAV